MPMLWEICLNATFVTDVGSAAGLVGRGIPLSVKRALKFVNTLLSLILVEFGNIAHLFVIQKNFLTFLKNIFRESFYYKNTKKSAKTLKK